MSIVIKVENLSKQYRLGSVGTGSLVHDLNRTWHRLRGNEDPYLKIGEENDRTIKGSSEYVWALKNINFDVKQGEVLGIIGRNGAGKSTLLKILSRTTSPTKGSVKIKGRVASLLEVGTGFHPELSGRENIFLNGAILGMTKKEIKSKFDEIVDFAGVERYIDTPVKRYSSGMYVRLAFGVAAHLEPEILIVDEVLAVGDAEFQKKALGKMGDMSKSEGRTVLIVSHSMGVLAQLCEKAILLNHGNIIKQDYTNEIINYYLRNSTKNEHGYIATNIDRDMAIAEAFTQNESGLKTISFTHLQKIEIVTKIQVNKWIKDAELRLVFKDVYKKVIFVFDIPLNEEDANGYNCIEIISEISANFLRPGRFSLTFVTFVHNQYLIDPQDDIVAIDIVDGGSKFAQTESMDYGYIFFEPKCRIQYV